MGIFFTLFVIYIGSMFPFSFIASLNEAKKAQDRKRARGKKETRMTQSHGDVEQVWSKRLQQEAKKMVKNISIADQKPRRNAPVPDSDIPLPVPSRKQASFQKVREENRKNADRYRSVLKKDQESFSVSSRQRSPGALDRQSLKQAIITKEILDKPLSLRHRR